MNAPATLAEHWDELAAVALLGADRRSSPSPPAGVAAELAAARRAGDAGDALLDQVALLAALRRGGLRPAPAVPLLMPAPGDHRRPCSPRASAVLRDVLSEWPVLFDEWLTCLGSGGWRLAPEIVVPLLNRFRADPRRRAALLEAAGPVGDWLVELFPSLLAPRPATATTIPEPVAPLPADFVRLAELDAATLAATLAQGLERGELTNRFRPLLVQLLGQVPAAHLAPVAAALHRAGTNPNTMGLALGLADFATLRHTMIQELLP